MPAGTPLAINEYERKLERRDASHTCHDFHVHINCHTDHGRARNLGGISILMSVGLRGWATRTKQRQERATKKNLL